MSTIHKANFGYNCLMEAVLTVCYYLVFTFLAYLKIFFKECSSKSCRFKRTILDGFNVFFAGKNHHDEIIYSITILKKNTFS